ncbi:hypothetical protein LTR86_011306, partial [Recurvomyces mirabilis]
MFLINERLGMDDRFLVGSGITAPRARGNLNYLETAAVARRMMVPDQSPNRAKKLWRVGRRLDMLITKFGIGILTILDEKLTHDMVLKVTDSVFDELVSIIDRFEGEQIRRLSERTYPIMDILFEESTEYDGTTFRFERDDNDLEIIQAIRCSQTLDEMLSPEVESIHTPL